MALTKVSTDGVKDDAITKAKIPADQIEASELANNAVDTNAIADQAVTLDKLPHGTSSNDGKFLRANNGADPSFETVSIPAGTTINNNADNRVITGSGTANTLEGESNLTFSGSLLSVTGNISLPDSAAPDYVGNIYVGNNSDLKIFHNGSDNFIRSGAGNADIKIDNNSGVLGARFIPAGAAELYHNGTKMVETYANGLVFPANKGICFENNSTSSASGVSNQDNDEIFNYYEFGDWTPVTNGSGMSMASSGGHYMRMGALVWVGCNMTFGSQSGGGTISIGGLPFASGSNVFGGGSVKYSNITPSSYDGIIMIHLDSGATTLHFPNISITEASGKRLDWSAVYPVYNF